MKKYIIAALVLSLTLCTGCSRQKQQPNAKTEPSIPATEATVPVSTPPTEATTSRTPSTQQVIKGEAGTPAKTPFITFYYPTQWTELTDIERVETEDSCWLVFRSNVGTLGELVIFALYIGPGEVPEDYYQDVPEGTEAYYHGTLDGMNVYTMIGNHNIEQLSEEDAGELGRQQEYVNELIQQIYENPDFNPV